MIFLVLGLALWTLAHLFKRIAPERRAVLGESGKGLAAAGILAGLVLMILGYRWAPFIPVYTPFPGAGHLNNLLVLVAFVLFGAGASKGVIWTRIRHPQLTAVKIWAFGHLLVNGDLASILLFGGLLGWAVAEVIVINRAEGPWQRPASGGWARDAKLLVIGGVLYAVAAGVHIWLGVNPFLGTYG